MSNLKLLEIIAFMGVMIYVLNEIYKDYLYKINRYNNTPTTNGSVYIEPYGGC